MGWLITVVFPFRGSDCKFSHLLNSWIWKSLWIMLTLISQSSTAEIRSSRSALAMHPQNLAFWESFSNLWCRWLLQISFFLYMITFSTMLPMGCAFDRSVRSVALTPPGYSWGDISSKTPLQSEKKGREYVLQKCKMTSKVLDLSWKPLKTLSLYNLAIYLQMSEAKKKQKQRILSCKTKNMLSKIANASPCTARWRCWDVFKTVSLDWKQSINCKCKGYKGTGHNHITQLDHSAGAWVCMSLCVL